MALEPWYKTALRWAQTNLVEIDPARYDEQWWREHWRRTRVQGVIVVGVTNEQRVHLTNPAQLELFPDDLLIRMNLPQGDRTREKAVQQQPGFPVGEKHGGVAEIGDRDAGFFRRETP